MAPTVEELPTGQPTGHGRDPQPAHLALDRRWARVDGHRWRPGDVVLARARCGERYRCEAPVNRGTPASDPRWLSR